MNFGEVKAKIKVDALDILILQRLFVRQLITEALSYGTRCQEITQFYLLVMLLSANGMNHTSLCLPKSSQIPMHSKVTARSESRDANETFSFETETRPRRLKVCSRRDRGETFPIFPETETFVFGFKTRPRPRPSFPRPRRFSRRYKRHTLLSLRLRTGTNYAVFPSL